MSFKSSSASAFVCLLYVVTTSVRESARKTGAGFKVECYITRGDDRGGLFQLNARFAAFTEPLPSVLNVKPLEAKL